MDAISRGRRRGDWRGFLTIELRLPRRPSVEGPLAMEIAFCRYFESYQQPVSCVHRYFNTEYSAQFTKAIGQKRKLRAQNESKSKYPFDKAVAGLQPLHNLSRHSRHLLDNSILMHYNIS